MKPSERIEQLIGETRSDPECYERKINAIVQYLDYQHEASTADREEDCLGCGCKKYKHEKCVCGYPTSLPPSGLVSLDEKEVFIVINEKLQKFMIPTGITFDDYDNISTKLSKAICQTFGQPSPKSLTFEEIDSIVGLKLAQMMVDNTPDKLGWTKSRVITEAILALQDRKKATSDTKE